MAAHGHWNERGQRLAAKMVAKYLLSHHAQYNLN